MRGFTLIETLVAITILLVGVIGPLTIAVQGISDGFFARNQIAANYLAQEAAEVILNRKLSNYDSYYPNEQDKLWDGLEECFNKTCIVDAKDGTIDVKNCDSGACNLVFDSVAGYYRNPDDVSGEPVGPIFQRKVEMKPINIKGAEKIDEVRVTVTVTWLNLALPRSLVLVENLYRY